MAKETKQPAPAVVPDAPEVLAAPKSFRLYIALGFVSLILFQMIVIFMMLPAPAKPPPIGGYNPGGPGGGIFDDTPLPAPNIGPEVRLVERQIGSVPLSVTQPRGDSNEVFTLTMHVTVREREQWRFDAEYERRTFRVIASVENVMRAATPAERNEVGHATIGERSRRAINEVLGTPWVQQVFITSATNKME